MPPRQSKGTMPPQLTYEKVDGVKHLSIRNLNITRNVHRMSLLAHPNFLMVYSNSDERILAHINSKTPLPTFGMEAVDASKVDSVYIPQMLSALKHAHSRGLIIGNLSFDTIAITGNFAIILDLSNSHLHVNEKVKYRGIINEFSAIETHIYGIVEAASDVYSFALWWMSARLRTLPSSWDTADPLKIQAAAIGSASPLQRSMLHKNPYNRICIEDVIKTHIQESHTPTVDIRKQELQVAYQNIIQSPDGNFAELEKYLTEAKVGELRVLMPSILCVAARYCYPVFGIRAHQFHGGFLKSLVNFMDKFNTFDTLMLSKVNDWECFHIDSLLVNFFAMDNEKAVMITRAFIEAKLFDVSDNFLVKCYECNSYNSSMESLLEMSPITPVTQLLEMVKNTTGDSAQDKAKIEELEATLLEEKSSMKELQNELKETKTELESLREHADEVESFWASMNEKKPRINKRHKANAE